MTEAREASETHGCGHGCGVGRRQFLGATLLTVAALLEAACGDGEIGGTGPDEEAASPTGSALPTTGLVVKVSSYPALGVVGGAARVDGGSGKPVALVRTSASAFTAFSLRCTHQGTTVNLVNNGFVCPNHGARFSLQGVWLGGQRTTNLVVFPNVYDVAAGTVVISR